MEELYRGERVDRRGWVYGDLQHNEIGDTWISGLVSNIDGIGGFFHNVRPESVGKYIGLKLKDGTKLFSNDICRYIHHDGYLMESFDFVILWNDEYACFGYKIIDPADIEEKGEIHCFSEHQELRRDFLDHCILGNVEPVEE